MNQPKQQKKIRQKIDGWVNLYKPSGIGSTKALSIVKRSLNAAKAGHAGTLDPMAEGILPIALGEATKTIPYIQDSDKVYSFTVKWGEQTDTEDAEGEVIATSEHRPTEKEIIDVLPSFTGRIEQIPPRYSAIKIQGQRAYDLAREGVEIEMKSRIVDIHSLECTKVNGDSAEFITCCGKGTYIRSLGRDIALELGTVGHITVLKRERVGCMCAPDAISLDFFQENSDKDALLTCLQPVETVLDDIPALPLKEDEAVKIRQGQKLVLSSRPDMGRIETAGIDPAEAKDLPVLLKSPNGTSIGIGKMNGVSVKPDRLFNLNT